MDTQLITHPTLDLIHAHASCRHYDTNAPVPDTAIETIVSAAQRASTSSNIQAWSVIAIRNAETRAELARLSGEQKHIAEAPVFLVWCADLARLDAVAALRGYPQNTEYLESFFTAAVDATLASQNAALAAEALGLGICYIGGLRNNPREVIQLLQLPKLVFPIFGMTVGYPSKPPRTRPRLPRSAMLNWETYAPTTEADLRAYDREMAQTGIYQGRQVPVPGKPEQMEDYGWLEHTARRGEKPARAQLSEILREQGFELK
jgi:nitroreductase